MPANFRSATRIYVGLGAYAAAALYVHFGISPWIGLLAAIAVAAACGAVIGFLAFRFGVAGVYFAILTIAFAEFARIGFDHFALGRRLGRLFPAGRQLHPQRPVEPARQPDHVLLRDAGADRRGIRARAICCSRAASAIYWQAIREDEEAARSLGINTFRYKMYAVVISAGMTAVAGVFFAFYYNNLFPEQVFNISRSIELILGPIIGGIGTLVRPDHRRIPAHRPVRAHAGAAARASASMCPAPSRCSTASACWSVVMVLPDGVWPWLARKLGLDGATGAS